MSNGAKGARKGASCGCVESRVVKGEETGVGVLLLLPSPPPSGPSARPSAAPCTVLTHPAHSFLQQSARAAALGGALQLCELEATVARGPEGWARRVGRRLDVGAGCVAEKGSSPLSRRRGGLACEKTRRQARRGKCEAQAHSGPSWDARQSLPSGGPAPALSSSFSSPSPRTTNSPLCRRRSPCRSSSRVRSLLLAPVLLDSRLARSPLSRAC